MPSEPATSGAGGCAIDWLDHMRIFHCDHCDHLVFFENTACVRCGHLLAFLPDLGEIGSLERVDDLRWRSPLAHDATYRLCRNYREENVCNWALADADTHERCLSCRLTRVVPDLGRQGNREAWYRLEVAKRRLVYTLLALQLPIVDRDDDPVGGLAFEFMADPDDPSLPPTITGHEHGVIRINVAEADASERERRRASLHEPYRTLLGHVRHEIGHYYWERLIAPSAYRLQTFRAVFGDEREDYAAALQRHYAEGPPADWTARFVSAYASAHAWEDWAETWAHYLHITDTVETAAACGVSIRPGRRNEPSMKALPADVATPNTPFERMMAAWYSLTYVLNNLNRGLGLPDGYPFVLSPAAVEKLRVVHEVIAGAQNSAMTLG